LARFRSPLTGRLVSYGAARRWGYRDEVSGLTAWQTRYLSQAAQDRLAVPGPRVPRVAPPVEEPREAPIRAPVTDYYSEAERSGDSWEESHRWLHGPTFEDEMDDLDNDLGDVEVGPKAKT